MANEMKTLTINGKTYEVVDETARENAKKLIGENPTGGRGNDTSSFWTAKSPGYYWISQTDQLVNQPSQYGFLINYVSDTDVFQIFRDQTDGLTYFRSGDNINNWFRHWTKVYDETSLTLATDTVPGLVIADGNNGIGVNTETGNLYIKQAENNEIDGKAHSYKPITPENLDYAIKAGLVNNANSLNETEQASVLGWIGAYSKTEADNRALELLNRSEAVNQANTNYGTYMARGFALVDEAYAGSVSAPNGCVTLVYTP